MRHAAITFVPSLGAVRPAAAAAPPYGGCRGSLAKLHEPLADIDLGGVAQS